MCAFYVLHIVSDTHKLAHKIFVTITSCISKLRNRKIKIFAHAYHWRMEEMGFETMLSGPEPGPVLNSHLSGSPKILCPLMCLPQQTQIEYELCAFPAIVVSVWYFLSSGNTSVPLFAVNIINSSYFKHHAN